MTQSTVLSNLMQQQTQPAEVRQPHQNSQGFLSRWCRLLLACGGVDGAVRLLVCSPGGTDFVQACKLVGHQDWVRSVALRHTAASGGTPGEPHAAPSAPGAHGGCPRYDSAQLLLLVRAAPIHLVRVVMCRPLLR